MIIKQCFLTKRPGKPLNHPTSITLHWIGAFPGQTPTIVRNYWESRKGEECAHFIIKDTQCMEAVPRGEIAYHCRCDGNFSSIGIELIPINTDGQFSEDTIATLIELLKQLPKVELKRHYDWMSQTDGTGKNCPLYYTPYVYEGEERWIEFKKELEDGRQEA